MNLHKLIWFLAKLTRLFYVLYQVRFHLLSGSHIAGNGCIPHIFKKLSLFSPLLLPLPDPTLIWQVMGLSKSADSPPTHQALIQVTKIERAANHGCNYLNLTDSRDPVQDNLL